MKPFFVRSAREKDRRSCLCRKHVETKIVLKDCMKFRKAACRRNGTDAVVPSTLTELVNPTLCMKPEGHSHHSLKCVTRECSDCGVSNLELLPEEVSEESMEQVTWKRYEYKGPGKFLSNGQEKKKIALVTKKTAPWELFKYFQDLLKQYPYHSFMAK